MEKPDIPQDDDWHHRFIGLDALHTVDEDWRSLVVVWEQKRAGRLLPPWSAFDMYDFVPWLGFIAVNKITHAPINTFTTLWGTELTELYGDDRTGRTLRESQVDWCITLKDMGFWERLATQPCIGRAEGTLYWQDRDYVRLDRFFLPFGEDGETVDTIISVTRRIDS